MKNSVYISRKCENIIHITSIVTLHYFEFHKDYYFSGESHPFWELLYIDKGQFTVIADGKEMVLKKGEAIFHKPNEFHINQSYNHTPANVFVISFICTSKAMKFFNNKIIPFSDAHKQLIGKLIQMGNATYELGFNDVDAKELKLKKDSLIGGQQLVRIYLEQLLVELLQDNSNSQKKIVYDSIEVFDDMLVNEIIGILKDQIYGTLSIPVLCKRLNYSKTYLSVFFKRKTNQSIMEYYRALKIQEAKHLLRSKQYNISQISALLHFPNPYYFSKVFRSIVGMPPSEYASLAKNRVNAPS